MKGWTDYWNFRHKGKLRYLLSTFRGNRKLHAGNYRHNATTFKNGLKLNVWNGQTFSSMLKLPEMLGSAMLVELKKVHGAAWIAWVSRHTAKIVAGQNTFQCLFIAFPNGLGRTFHQIGFGQLVSLSTSDTLAPFVQMRWLED